MTPAKRAKLLGAKSLAEIANTYGCTRRNLELKFYSDPLKFDVIVLGVIEFNKLDDKNEQ